jgi:hypothetical protein
MRDVSFEEISPTNNILTVSSLMDAIIGGRVRRVWSYNLFEEMQRSEVS